jgi:hypothetical protein
MKQDINTKLKVVLPVEVEQYLDRYFELPAFPPEYIPSKNGLDNDDKRMINRLYVIYQQYGPYKWQLALSIWRLNDKLDEMRDIIKDLQEEIKVLKGQVNRIDSQVNEKEY